MSEPVEAESRPLTVWILIVSAVVLAALATPLWLGEVFSLTDLWILYLPLRAFYAQCLAAGDWPLWYPNLFAGYYVHGTGHAGMSHPLQFLLYRFLPLYIAFDLEILLAFPFMFAGFYLFLRRWSIRRDCALFGAMLCAFSTFNIMRLIHLNALQIMAHIPWVLYCADIVVRSTNRRHVIWAAVGLAALNASELLLGYPQYYWISFVSLFLYLLLLWWISGLPLVRTGMIVAAFVLGVAGGAAQLLPTADALGISVRKLSATWEANAPYEGSIRPRLLVQGLDPYLWKLSHRHRVYAGAVPLLLMVVAAARWKRLPAAHRPLVVGSLLCIVLMVWLSLGKYGYLYELQVRLPVVNIFRFPSRYLHVASLAMALVGAVALADLMRLRAKRESLGRPTLWALLAVVILSEAVAASAFYTESWQSVTMPGHLMAGPVLFLCGALLIVATARGIRFAPGLLVALTAADISYYAMTYAVWYEHSPIDERLASQSTPPTNDQSLRLLGGRIFDLDSLAMSGWKRIDGFEGLPPYKRLDYRVANARRVANVGWVTRATQQRALHGFARDYSIFSSTDVEGLPGTSDDLWFHQPDPLPRVRCVTKTVVSDEPAKAIVDIDVVTTALVDEPVDLDDQEPGTATLVSERPGVLQLKATVPGKQLVVISESHHPGWVAETADGKPLEILRVNGDFLGVIVPAGDHDISLRFDPPSFRQGVMVSLGALAVMLLWAASAFLSQRPSPVGPPVVESVAANV